MRLVQRLVHLVPLMGMVAVAGCSDPAPAPSSGAPGSASGSVKASSSVRASTTTPSSSSTTKPAPPINNSALKGEIDRAPVEYKSAAAWQLRPTAVLVIFGSQGGCAELKPFQRDRTAFDPKRLDVLFTQTLEANGSLRWRPTDILPLAGISGKLEGELPDHDASKPLLATVDLDFYEKEGPTVKLKGSLRAEGCGTWTDPNGTLAVRPQPDLKVEYGGKSFAIQGALVDVFDDGATMVSIATGPLDCEKGWGDLSGSELLLRAGQYGKESPVDVEVRGDSIPREWVSIDAGASIDSKLDKLDSGETKGTLSWTFTRGGFKGVVSGTATLRICNHKSTAADPSASTSASAAPP